MSNLELTIIETEKADGSYPETLQTIASKHGAKIIHSTDEIDGCSGNLSGLSAGLLKDLAAGPELAIDYFGRKIGDLLGNISFDLEEIELYPNPTKRKLWLIPGYGASSGHFNTICAYLGSFAKPHPEFSSRRITKEVLNDASLLTSSIRAAGQKIELGGHSRGGLVILCTLQILQDLGLDHLVTRSILLSPISHGVRPEASALARHLGINALNDLCPGSEPTQFWQRLTPSNRAKIQIVSQEGGDAFTSPEKSFVPGGTMFLTPHCGHQDTVRNPRTPYFQLAVDLVKHPVIPAN